MAYRYDYKKYDTRKLVEIWCFNSNVELTDKIEKYLIVEELIYQQRTYRRF